MVYKVAWIGEACCITTVQCDRYEASLRTGGPHYDGDVSVRFYPPLKGPVRVARW